MNQGRHDTGAKDQSEETVVAPPRFDDRAEERARPVVPLGDGPDEVTRLSGTPSASGPRIAAGLKSPRSLAFIVASLFALLAAGALAISRQGRPAEVQITPSAETPAVPPEGGQAARGEEGGRARRATASRREGVSAGTDPNEQAHVGRGEGEERSKGEREKDRDKERDKDKDLKKRFEKEREKHRERVKEAEKELRRFKELFKDN